MCDDRFMKLDVHCNGLDGGCYEYGSHSSWRAFKKS